MDSHTNSYGPNGSYLELPGAAPKRDLWSQREPYGANKIGRETWREREKNGVKGGRSGNSE